MAAIQRHSAQHAVCVMESMWDATCCLLSLFSHARFHGVVSWIIYAAACQYYLSWKKGLCEEGDNPGLSMRSLNAITPSSLKSSRGRFHPEERAGSSWNRERSEDAGFEDCSNEGAAKKHRRPPETGRDKEQIVCSCPWREGGPPDILISAQWL